jgi:hypothetical protein
MLNKKTVEMLTRKIVRALFLFPILSLFKIRNFRKKKIFLYTDSRGFDAPSLFRSFLWNSYVRYLISKYLVDFQIHTEKYTLLLDFVEFYRSNDLRKYDYIILHVGISDFSPRPLSNIEDLLNYKKGKAIYKKLLLEDASHRSYPTTTFYRGEKTNTLYSTKFFKENILPQIKKIDNIIWITSNKFVCGWEGNYTKGRPENIGETVSLFQDIMREELKGRVVELDWTDDEVMEYTVDNIHFTSKGFCKVFDKIVTKIEEPKS